MNRVRNLAKKIINLNSFIKSIYKTIMESLKNWMVETAKHNV